MARELSIKITADASAARTELQRTEQAMSDLSKSFLEGKTSLEEYNKQTAILQAQQKKLSDALAQAEKPAASFVKQMASLSAVVAGFVSADLLIGAAKDAIRFADEVTKLADKTDIGGEALQRLGFAAEQSGNTMQQVANTVSMMSKRIGEGETSAVGALTQLGISYDEIRKKSPDEQFRVISAAIEQVDDVARKAALGNDIFGRSFAELQPTIKAVAQGVGDDIVVMGEQTRKTLDEWGDMWDRGVARMRVAVGNITAITLESATAVKDWVVQNSVILNSISVLTGENAPKPPKELKPPVNAPLAVPQPTSAMWKENEDAIRKNTLAIREREAALRAEEAYIKRLQQIAHDDELKELFKTPLLDARQTTGVIGELVDANVTRITLMTTQFEKWAPLLQHVGNNTRGLGEEFDKIREKTQTIGETLLKSFGEIPAMIGDALAGGASWVNVALSVGAKIGDALKKGIAKSLGDKVGSAAGTGAGIAGALGGAVGGGGAAITGQLAGLGGAAILSTTGLVTSAVALGAATAGIGAAAVGAYIAIRHFTNDAEKKINPLRQSFVDAAGGLDALNKKAHEAGTTLDALLDAKKPEQYQKAVEDLAKAFEFQTQAMQTLDDTVKKYGFTFDQLGAEHQAKIITGQAGELFKDLQVLAAGGIDQATILANTKIQKSFQELVKEAMKSGQALPNQLKPFIQQLIDAGKLVDDTGKKITDIGQLNFADTLKGQFDDLIKSIQDLVAAITRGLNPAIAAATSSAASAPQGGHNTTPNVPNYNPGEYGTYETFHAGGMVTAHRGLMLGANEVMVKALRGERVLNIQETKEYNARRAWQDNFRGPVPYWQDPENHPTGISGGMPITIDARGAVFSGQGVSEFSRRLREQIMHGPDATAWRGTLRRK